jgi:hypothetical protein
MHETDFEMDVHIGEMISCLEISFELDFDRRQCHFEGVIDI